jgi:hypothetical protein
VNGWRTQVAVIAVLAGALALRWMEKKNPAHLEAVIGVGFVAAACAAVVLALILVAMTGVMGSRAMPIFAKRF